MSVPMAIAIVTIYTMISISIFINLILKEDEIDKQNNSFIAKGESRSMEVYVLKLNGYANLEYYDISSGVIGIYSSKEKAIDAIYSEVASMDGYAVSYNEEDDEYDLVGDKESGGYNTNSWYTIEKHTVQ